ncbi:MAG: peptidoglycan-binding domain-containing protein [Pseudomonadota bacterium]
MTTQPLARSARKPGLRWAAAGFGLALAMPAAAIDDNTDTLPDANPGECYAKVMVPANYRDETTTVVVKEAAEKVEIIPAKYEMAEERVLVAEASTKLVPVPAVWGDEKQVYEISPATTNWVAGSLKSNVRVNPVVLRAATDGGVDLTGAEPGRCYHEHYQAPKFEDKVERVLVAQASEEVKVVPAKYDLVEERVLVKPASKKLVEVPAVYETVEERVLVEPAKSEWKQGRGLIEKIDGSTGEIMCLIEVPAKYKTVKKRVVKTPASTKVVEIPAEYQNIKVRKLVSDSKEVRNSIPAKYQEVAKRVKVSDAKYVWHPVETPGEWGPKTGNVICKKDVAAKTKTVVRKVVKTPASFQKVSVPAKYEVKKVRKLVADAREVRTKIPEETNTVTKRVKVSNARLEWRSVLCETNMSTDVIANVQGALQKAGFDPGPADGLIGRKTLLAIDAYQRREGLATGGLTMATLKALGISI